ncbi:hypothetical protein TWF694_011084 [Orbilia ellipsospora]|uniref:F-box domain-containing protein n=1 Tax=Orbilia ellipsospora TaxID=2528407 RepID=A0AAV9XE84_9PEZI
MDSKKPHLLELPTEVILRVFENLDRLRRFQPPARYPVSGPLGPSTQFADGSGNFDSLSRCCKKLRSLSLPYLFRCLNVCITEEQTAIETLRFYMGFPGVLQHVRILYFVMEIRARAALMPTLPVSFMEPSLSDLMPMIATFFKFIPYIENLHFIVRESTVGGSLRKIFQKFNVNESFFSHVRALKFSIGSEWMIDLCGTSSGLEEVENSPAISGNDYLPYSIDYVREEAASRTADGYLSRIGDCRAASMMKGIRDSTLLNPGSLQKVCIYGRFTQAGLDMFVAHVPFVTNLTIIGETMPIERAIALGRLEHLRVLNIEGELGVSRGSFQSCPVHQPYLWNFAYYIPSLQQMWYAGRFAGNIFRNIDGQTIFQDTMWIDSFKSNIVNDQMEDFDLDMEGC